MALLPDVLTSMPDAQRIVAGVEVDQAPRHRALCGLALALVLSICVVGTARAQERGTIQATARVLPGDSAERGLVRRAVARSAEGGTVRPTSGRYARIRVQELPGREREPGVWDGRRLVVYVEYLRN